MIIGISGRARSGKDEVASYLVAAHGFRRRAFADSLKEAAGAIFGLSGDQLYGHLKESTDPFWKQSPRYIMQKLGTECLRQGYDQEVWVQSLRRYMFAHPDQREWVVPDVRFVNEIRAVRDWGGVVWRLKRAGLQEVGISGHASETSLDGHMDWDLVINNDGTLDDLHARVDEALS